MTRASERTTVTSEAVPDVALSLSADRGYHGTALGQIAEALKLRVPRVCNHTQSEHGLLTAPARAAGTRHDGHAGFATDQPPAAAERITRIGTAASLLRLDCTTGAERGVRVHSWRQNAATPSDQLTQSAVWPAVGRVKDLI
jgi:hypothetical protein